MGILQRVRELTAQSIGKARMDGKPYDEAVRYHIELADDIINTNEGIITGEPWQHIAAAQLILTQGYESFTYKQHCEYYGIIPFNPNATPESVLTVFDPTPPIIGDVREAIIEQTCVECGNNRMYSLAPDYPHLVECTMCGHPQDLITTSDPESFINNYETDVALNEELTDEGYNNYNHHQSSSEVNDQGPDQEYDESTDESLKEFTDDPNN
jgi:hypothetical protein